MPQAAELSWAAVAAAMRRMKCPSRAAAVQVAHTAIVLRSRCVRVAARRAPAVAVLEKARARLGSAAACAQNSLLLDMPMSTTAVNASFADIKTGGLSDAEAREYYAVLLDELPCVLVELFAC